MTPQTGRKGQGTPGSAPRAMVPKSSPISKLTVDFFEAGLVDLGVDLQSDKLTNIQIASRRGCRIDRDTNKQSAIRKVRRRLFGCDGAIGYGAGGWSLEEFTNCVE